MRWSDIVLVVIAFITNAIMRYENESNNNPHYLHDPSRQLNEAKWRYTTSENGVYADPVGGMFPSAPMLIILSIIHLQTKSMKLFDYSNVPFAKMHREMWQVCPGPLLLTWFNFNPSMDK